MKFYRWFDFYKWDMFIIISGILFFGWLISCQPTNHTDVQMRTFTTDTLKTDTNAN